MDVSNVTKILKVLRLMGQMPMVGEGTTRPTIIHYSSVSHSTVYRYLPRMVALQLVDVTEIENNNNIMVAYYKITKKGIGYVMDDKELLGEFN